jgi:hypothetical protein
MSSKLSTIYAALCLALAITIGLLFTQSSNAADQDDHSYLPPWMLNESGAVVNVDDKAASPKTPPGDSVPQITAEAQRAVSGTQDSANLTAKAAQVSSRVVGFVHNIFRRSILLATGD